MVDIARPALARRMTRLLLSALFVISCAGSENSDSGGGGAGGRAGTSGVAGASGAAGASGVAGASGTGGVAGSAGSAGTTGGAGTTGVAGQVGAGGSAGSGGRGGSAGAGSGGAGGAGGAGRGGAGGTAAGGGSGGGGAAGAAGTTGAGGAPTFPPKYCGNIDQRGQVPSTFANYWNQVTPENAGKWGSVQPSSQTSFNWGGLDAIHNYAKQHNIPFKQHNFIWGAQQPSWVSGLSQADQKAAVENWIKAFCQRYPDTQMIDVVNEPPPHTTPPYVAALGGAGASGYDWIVQAFNWAHQYCPSSILILNDYNIIEYSADNTRMINMVNAIKKAGAPIHAIGSQSHAAANLPTSTVQMYLDKLATQTGLPVMITEYDINLADDTQQANVMQSQFTMFWNDPNVKGVTVWGYIEGQTWETNSGLMSASGVMRPAMTWLMNFLGR